MINILRKLLIIEIIAKTNNHDNLSYHFNKFMIDKFILYIFEIYKININTIHLNINKLLYFTENYTYIQNYDLKCIRDFSKNLYNPELTISIMNDNRLNSSYLLNKIFISTTLNKFIEIPIVISDIIYEYSGFLSERLSNWSLFDITRKIKEILLDNIFLINSNNYRNFIEDTKNFQICNYVTKIVLSYVNTN